MFPTSEFMAKQNTFAFLLPLLLVCAAILAAYSFLPKPAAEAPSGGAISLFLQGGPLVSGNNAALRAVSTCGAFGVLLDGAEFGGGSPLLSRQFLLEEGSHSFFAQGKNCNSTLSFTVLARECEANETKVCEKSGCAGARKCAGGIFSECALPERICYPGEKVGCSTDSCSFGYMVCNACGTGFGKCAPGTANQNNSTCAGKQSCN